MKNNFIFLVFLLFGMSYTFSQEYTFISKDFVKMERETFFSKIKTDTLTIINAYFENGKILTKKANDSLINSGEIKFYIQNYFVNLSNKQVLLVYKKLNTEEKKRYDNTLKESARQKRTDFKKLDKTVLTSLELIDLEKKRYTLDSLSNKVIVINFWFTKCKPCVAEIPYLNKIKRKYKEREVAFFAVTFDNEKILKEFITNKEFDFTIIPNGRKIIDQFYIQQYPTTVIIDKNKRINIVDDLLVVNITNKIDKMIDKLLKD